MKITPKSLQKCFRPELLTALLAVLLTAGGLLAVYSVTWQEGLVRFGVQCFALLLGLIGFILLWRFDISRAGDLFYIILFSLTCAVLLLTVFIGEGPGNRSWIRISWLFFDIQPSEVAKVTYIVTLSRHLSRWNEHRFTWRGITLLSLHILLPILLVLLQKDVGNAMVFAVIAVVMLFFAGLPLRFFAIGAGGCALLSPLLWYLLGSHRQERILSGFRPYADPLGYGWQSLAAQRAVTSGSWFGNGFLHTALSSRIPAVHTDMIFAAICEQFGLVGSGVILLLLTGLCVLWIMMSRTRAPQSALICCGGAALIAVQTIEVAAMTLGLLPIVGVSLPFVSYGGSSLFSTYLLCGVIVGAKSK